MNKKKFYNASALLEVDANINIIDGANAWEKLIKVVEGLHHIGAISEKPDDIESYCDEIVRLGF